MKTRKIVFWMFVSLFVISGDLYAQDYTGATGLRAIFRSPSASRQALDSDIRLRSMGGLDLAVEDESNTIGAFKYGESPAGLPLDYTQGKVEVDYLFENGEVEDNQTNSTAHTGEVVSGDQHVINAMSALPFQFDSGGSGAFVISGGKDTVNFEGGTSYENFLGVTSLEDEPSLTRFVSGYGHRLGNLLLGIGFSKFDIDFLNTSFNQAGTNVEQLFRRDQSLVSPSVGYVFEPGEDQQIVAFAGPTFHHQKIQITSSGVGPIMDLDGTRFDGGVIYSYGSVFKTALTLQTGKVDGDVDGITGGTGDVEVSETDVKARAYLKPEGLPVSFGVEIKSESDETERKNASGVLAEDEEQKELEIGLGVAGHFPDEKGLVGLEYTFISADDEDSVAPTDPDENEESKGFQLSLGGEYRVIEPLWVRAGVKLRNVGEDPEGTAPELDTKTTEINLGFEYLISEAASVALAYANTSIKGDGSASVPQDEDEYNANSLHLMGKFKFGGEE